MPDKYQENKQKLNQELPDVRNLFLSANNSIQSVPLRVCGNALSISEWCRLTGFRQTGAAMQEYNNQLANSLLSGGDAAIAAVKTETNTLQLYIGAGNVRRTIGSIYPEARITRVSPTDSLFEDYPYGGVIAGKLNEDVDWDSIIRALPASTIVCFLSRPLSPSDILSCRNGLSSAIDTLSLYKMISIPTGYVGNRAVRDRPDEGIQQIIEAIKLRQTDFESSNIYTSCLWYGAKSQNNANIAEQILLQRLGGYAQRIEITTFSCNGFYIPSYRPTNLDLFKFDLLENRLVRTGSPNTIINAIPLPCDEHPGLEVIVPIRDETSYLAFDITPHTGDLRLGAMYDNPNINEYINVGSLNQHALIAGGTGSGKSEAAAKIVQNVMRKNIPVLMLEPVGSSSELAHNLNFDYLYSCDDTGPSLIFNPCIPELFVRIGDHIKGLANAIVAATDNTPPIPQALEMVLEEAYLKHHWKPNDLVRDYTGRNFPDFAEIRNMIIPFFKNSGLYTGDPKINVASALYLRFESLCNYPFLIGEKKFPTEKVLSRNTIINFAALSQAEDKCFFGNLILMNLNEALRRDPGCNTLTHLIVLDEAHNIFLKPNPGANTSASVVGNMISSILSEMRKYGTGLLLCDQRPAMLHSNAIANTTAKILMAMDYKEDIDAVSVYSLSGFQKAQYHRFEAGEAVVTVRGENPITHVKIEMAEKNNLPNLTMCQHCGFSHRCVRDQISQILPRIPSTEYQQQLSQNIANPDALNRTISKLFKESKIAQSPPQMACLLGHVIEPLSNEYLRGYLCNYYMTEYH